MFRSLLSRAVLLTLAAAVAGGQRPVGLPAGGYASPQVLVTAVFADGYDPGEADEALQLWNVGGVTVDLSGWQVESGGQATFPSGAVLPAGAFIWLAREEDAFRASFGHPPDWVWGRRAGRGTARQMVSLYGGPALPNGGGVVRLRQADGVVADVVAYGRVAPAAGWQGPPVQPYTTAAIGRGHQVLYRKLDPATGLPVPDTDRAPDWASDRSDVRLGRRVRFPGWEVEDNLRPVQVRQRARLTVAVAPDSLSGFLSTHLATARRSVDVLTYTFDNPELAKMLVERAQAGAQVRVLVDGNPAGGVTPNQRWCLAQVVAAGGAVYWHDDAGPVGRRYRAMHAKLILIDDRLVLAGSENLSLGAAPGDDLSDGTSGHRGVFLATDAPAVVAWAQEVVDRDLDQAHLDRRPFQWRDPVRGAPAPDYVPPRLGGGSGYNPVAPVPLQVEGQWEFTLLTAPENALQPGGLVGLVAQAGAGDEVLVEQLAEPWWWGDPAEGPVALNPRWQAYLQAARRGARVRVLLDGYFDDSTRANSNAAAARMANELARAEDLDLVARLGNPTGLGIHNKMVLVALQGRGVGMPLGHSAHRLNLSRARLFPGGDPLPWSGGRLLAVQPELLPALPSAVEYEYWTHLGSLNGSETAHKANREVAWQVNSAPVHGYLARVFAWDWARTGARVWLPWLAREP